MPPRVLSIVEARMQYIPARWMEMAAANIGLVVYARDVAFLQRQETIEELLLSLLPPERRQLRRCV